MAVVSAIAAASVPVLINVKTVPSTYPTILSLLVSILMGVKGIGHLQEHGKSCDLIKTLVLQESRLYHAGTPSGAHM